MLYNYLLIQFYEKSGRKKYFGKKIMIFRVWTFYQIKINKIETNNNIKSFIWVL